MPEVTFIPDRKKITVPAGTSLLEAFDQAGIYIESDCAGKGTCGKCRTRILEGNSGTATPAEKKHFSVIELKTGSVLACQRKVENNCTVEAPTQRESHARKALLDPKRRELVAEPAIVKTKLQLPLPSIKDQRPDLERLLEEIECADLQVGRRELQSLPSMLRNSGYEVTVATKENRLLSVEPGDSRDRLYGIAFDIGTTTIVGSLLDLRKAHPVAIAAATNPQNIYGADVISRITHASRGEKGLHQLQDKVIGAANEIISNLLDQAGIDNKYVYEIVAVGNTTMSHLFMGIDPTYLAPAPFIPAYNRALDVEASELGLNINPAGRVIFLPNIAGYVGSDTVGVILATGLDQEGDCCVAIDIGTNGELVLRANGRLVACSTAAGPAFEGAQIKMGMRASAGAVESVKYQNGRIEVETIDKQPACGICGSGLIDAAAALLDAGVIEASGRFTDPEKVPTQLKTRLRRGEGGSEFVLVPGSDSEKGEDIILTQGDLRELQLAKGAIYAGLMILLKETGIEVNNLDRILLAGAFGNYVRAESALKIGLLPGLPPQKISAIGNAAGEGACMTLSSLSSRKRSFELPGRVEHIELSTRPDFQEIFVEALPFR